MDILNYLISASICMALCYLPYILIFKKLTFFPANRFYLLAIVAASIIIPALHIKIIEPLAVQHIDKHIVTVHNGFIETDNLLPAAKQQFYLNWIQIAGFAYSIICLAMLAKMFYNIFKIVRQARLSGIIMGNNLVVQNHNANNSSFFNIIFLHSKNADGLEMEQVLTHEKEHARLLHSADNLFIETVKAFFWFNPFIYLIADALKEVHEYEVDQALKNIFDAKQYASLLVRLSARPALNLANQFSAYSLKARISMLFKPRSTGYKKWCYVLILPVLLATVCWFSIERVYGGTSIKKDFVLVLDAGHGGNNPGAVGIGGRCEKDLTLQIAKQIKLIAEQRGIRVIMTRTADQSLEIRDRINNKADAFISIHINSHGPVDKNDENGMSIIASKNSLPQLSKKLAVNVKKSLQQLKGINRDHEIELNDNPPMGLHILSNNKAPSILVELGYITNQNDMNYVLAPNNQHAIAEKIIDAVVAFGNSK
jgi:N-acetylmuramoyl-L-alanine amidase